MHDWIVYVREGCHLCDSFVLDLALELGAEFDLVRLVDVDQDADLAVQFGLRVPVLEHRGRIVCEAQVDPALIRAATQL
jgi:hypothetical protein